jgi:small multidrug resistance pump
MNTMTSPFLLLLGAIFSEVIATTSLKASDGFTKPLPSLLVIIGYGIAFYLMSLAIRTMPVGTAYAIWAGLGTALTVLVGVLIYRESLDLARVAGVALIVAGVIVLNIFAKGAVA